MKHVSVRMLKAFRLWSNDCTFCQTWPHQYRKEWDRLRIRRRQALGSKGRSVQRLSQGKDDTT
jgi:hypothetical protein